MATRSEHVQRNPGDSLKSTWRRGDKTLWNIHQHIYEILSLHPEDLDREVPVHAKTDRLPYLPHLENHKWILVHALWPLVIHQTLFLAGWNMPTLVAFAFYTFSFKFNAIREIRKMKDIGHKHGYFDGDKHARDQVPDTKTRSVLNSLIATATIRPMAAVFLAYQSRQAPLSTLSWFLPLEIGLYSTMLDFYFYWYHRIMHESETLWQYHRTHHITKHPSPLLSLYADQAQEVFDIIGIPILTYLTMRLIGLPLGFADWWICQQYVVFTELWGHSGLRVYVTPPTTFTPLLRLFDAELITEDHDIHHRKGWKSSYNYGKQTRLWDRLFGTCHERYESLEKNIDWDDPVLLPIW